MSKFIYKTNANNSARYILGEQGQRPLIYIGVNPSKASPEKLDATTTRAKNFSIKLGYDGWLMINLYAQRATLPENIHKRINKALHQENLAILKSHFNNEKQALNIVASWGNLLEHRKYFPYCLDELTQLLNNYSANWYQLGAPTKLGHPRHLSRLGYAVPLLPFKF